MNFELLWTLKGARYVTEKECDKVNNNPNDKKAVDELIKANKSFSRSLDILNIFCRKEMSQYRNSLINTKNEDEQEKCLDDLYKKYLKEYNKHKNRL